MKKREEGERRKRRVREGGGRGKGGMERRWRKRGEAKEIVEMKERKGKRR